MGGTNKCVPYKLEIDMGMDFRVISLLHLVFFLPKNISKKVLDKKTGKKKMATYFILIYSGKKCPFFIGT